MKDILLYRWEYTTYLGRKCISKGYFPNKKSFALSISPYSYIIGPVLSTEKKLSLFDRIQSWQKPLKNGGRIKEIVQSLCLILNWHTSSLKKFG